MFACTRRQPQGKLGVLKVQTWDSPIPGGEGGDRAPGNRRRQTQIRRTQLAPRSVTAGEGPPREMARPRTERPPMRRSSPERAMESAMAAGLQACPHPCDPCNPRSCFEVFLHHGLRGLRGWDLTPEQRQWAEMGELIRGGQPVPRCSARIGTPIRLALRRPSSLPVALAHAGQSTPHATRLRACRHATTTP